MKLQGGCFCGAVRYEAEGEPFNSTLCHCTDCRKTSGAPALAWFSVRRDELRWIGAEPQLFRSSAHALRGFCPSCGASLAFLDDEWPDEIDIATASLNDPELVPPRDHTFVHSRLSWMDLRDGLPEYQRTRTEG